MRIFDFLALLALFAALGFGAYLFWMNMPGESLSYKPFLANLTSILPAENVNASNSIVQFYPNMRFKEKSISYRLESVCPAAKFNDIQRAFNILSDKTVLTFYYTKDDPEIRVMCSEIAPEAGEAGHFIAGEGGPSEIISTSNYAVILNAKISLYHKEECDEPKIAIHEILHALGFDHYNNSMSILYPITGCEQQIDSEIISDINKLYRTESLPDLVIDSIVANRTGRYLNFDINVSNEGLQDSKGADLGIYSGNDRIANFTIGKLEIGTKKMMYVQNVALPMGSDTIAFVVDSQDRELSLENNRAELSLA
jgi:hypothetical protein